MILNLKQRILVHALDLLFALLAHIRNDQLFRWAYHLLALLAETRSGGSGTCSTGTTPAWRSRGEF